MGAFLFGCATHKPVVVQEATKPIAKVSVTAPAKKSSTHSSDKRKPEGDFLITPSRPANTVMIDHKFFQIAYDPKHRMARYVVYQLTAEQVSHKDAGRKDKFIVDPILQKKGLPLVEPDEYLKTGYDRGHLAPSADFSWNQEANDKTFVMSNMAPQLPGLNRGAWKRLEEKVRRWACGEKKVSVITGPILSPGLPKLKGGLEIPQDFFKIVIDETPPTKVISFLYHQTDKGDVMNERVVSIEGLGKSAGIAFDEEFPLIKAQGQRMPASANEWKEADCQ